MTLTDLVHTATDQQASAPPDYIPALIGLFGVLVGAAITALSQWIQRRAEHLKYIRENLASVLKDAYLLEIKFTAMFKSSDLSEDRRPPEQFFNDIVKEINAHSESLVTTTHHVVLIASRTLSDLTADMTDACTFARNYYQQSSNPDHPEEWNIKTALAKVEAIRI